MVLNILLSIENVLTYKNLVNISCIMYIYGYSFLNYKNIKNH